MKTERVSTAACQLSSWRRLCSPFAVSVVTLTCWILVLFAQPAVAQVTRQTRELPHVAYGAIFGTGIYNINDRTVTLFRIPFSYQIRDLTADDFGIKLRLPVTISLSDFDFDDILGVERDDASSIGFVPGLELQFAVRQNWLLKPFAQAGYDFDLSSSQNTLTYAAGVLSRLDIGGKRLTVGNELTVAGYKPDSGDSGSIGYFSIGLDYRFPLGWRPGGKSTSLGTYGIGYFYFDNLEFERIILEPVTIRREVELGIAIVRDPPMSILGFEFDRIGLGYRFGGQLDAILLVTSFPF